MEVKVKSWYFLSFCFLRQKLNIVNVKQMAMLSHNKYLKKIKLCPACLLMTVPAPIVTVIIIIGGFTVYLLLNSQSELPGHLRRYFLM